LGVVAALKAPDLLSDAGLSQTAVGLSKNFAKVIPSPQGRVALLGFAYRHISIKFTQKTRKPSQPKPLPASVKTMADWIQVKLREHGMAPYHLAAKMGIATSLVKAWEAGTSRPDTRQMRALMGMLGKYYREMNTQPPALTP
jgi:ribosome-binding protein aMBF1 (putative translation factor)